MALVFTVSAPTTVFTEPHGTLVADTLRAQFGDAIDYDSTDERYSCELGWSGWSTLQQRAADACGTDAIPHLLSMEAWSGAYVPVETETGTFEFPGDGTNLDIGCLSKLIAELELIGNVLDLPIDDDSLDKLYHHYADDDDLVDDDMDIQTFTQLLPLARYALKKRLPLWVVK